MRCFLIDSVLKRLITASLAALLAAVSAAHSQERDRPRGSLGGMVRDTSGAPLSLVHLTVALDSPRTAFTDTMGTFQIDGLPVGIHRVLFRRIGYFPADFQLIVLEGATRRVVVELIASPIQLDTITAATGSVHIALERTGFYERLRQARDGAGVGRFITPEDLERVRALIRTTHILETGGVRLVQNERGMTLWPVGSANILQRRSDRNTPVWGPCQMAVFIDGIEVDIGKYWDPREGGGLDSYVQPSEIRAIEIYHSASGTPIQFQSVRNALCGSIVIWTKSG